MSSRRLAQLLLFAAVALWGATFSLVKDALQDISPLLFNLLRMSIASLVLLALHLRELKNLPRRAILAGLVVGVFLASGYQFQTAGLARTTPTKSAFITGLVVVFVPLLTAIPALRPSGAKAPGGMTILGALIAFAGLFLLTTPVGTTCHNLFSNIGFGDLLTLLCAVAFAGHLLSLAHATVNLAAGPLATLQITAATLVMALTLPLGGEPQFHLTLRLVLVLLLTGLLATAAAFTVQSFAQQHLPPTETALILTLEPVFAWLTSLLFLHEHLDHRNGVGALCILFGIAIIELLPNRSQVAPIPV